MKLWIVICLILFVPETNASPANKKVPDTIVRAGEKVPFDGVLQDEFSYKELVSNESMSLFYQDALELKESELSDCEGKMRPRTVLDYVGVFAVGLVVGGLYNEWSH